MSDESDSSATPDSEDEVFVFPASCAQERVWFLEQLCPGTALYNVPIAVKLDGPVNLRAAERTIAEIVFRHEILRTAFLPGVDGPLQVIGAVPPVPLRHVDLRGLRSEALEAESARIATANGARPFDLGRAPLLRAVLVQVSDEDNVLLVASHRLVCDSWSVMLLVEEAAALYPAFTAGAPSPLPALAIQYADFAEWERQWLETPSCESQLAYWREHLRGMPERLDLPFDRSRPPVRSNRGALHVFDISPSLLESLTTLGATENATLFMVLLAAFSALLGALAGQEDVCVGTPVAKRSRPEVQKLIGPFANLLALRTELRSDQSFREVLRRVREGTLDAWAHEDVPFERVVATVRPRRDPGLTPLFQVAMAVEHVPAGWLQPQGQRVAVDDGTAKFDLTLTLYPGPAGAVAALEYSTDLFDAETAVRLSEQFVALLRQVIEDRGQPLSRYAIVGRRAGPPTTALPATVTAPGTVALTDGLPMSPRSDLEQIVAAAWQNVLGAIHIGASENFFDIGGDSLRLVRVRDALARALGRDVPVIDLFAHPTIRTLARHLDSPAPGSVDVGKNGAGHDRGLVAGIGILAAQRVMRERLTMSRERTT